MKKTFFLAFLALAIIGTANAQKIKSENVSSSSSSTSSNPVKKAASKAKPSNTSFAFLMGWDGLGDNLFSGMSSNANDPYGTKPWFNSWQLEFSYNVFRVNKTTGYIGIGYESDVYKFDNDGNSGFIYLDESGTVPTMKYAENGTYFTAHPSLKTTGWESRLCTRYVTIPLGVDFKIGEDFGIGLAVIPGINFTTKHTGLKYKLDGDNQASLRDPLKGHISPVKCDVRANIKFDLVNLFVQVSPISVFKDTDKDVYPFRFGFMLKL